VRMKFLAPPVCARLDSKHAGVARAVFLGRASGMRALRAAVSGGAVLSGVRRSQNWTRGTDCKRVFITNVKGTFFGMSESEEASKRR